VLSGLDAHHHHGVQRVGDAIASKHNLQVRAAGQGARSHSEQQAKVPAVTQSSRPRCQESRSCTTARGSVDRPARPMCG
jgi:hypothetical protein